MGCFEESMKNDLGNFLEEKAKLASLKTKEKSTRLEILMVKIDQFVIIECFTFSFARFILYIIGLMQYK